MFIFLESAMQQEKFRKIMRTVGTIGMVVGAAIVAYALVFPISPTPKSAAAFKTWEAQQMRQEGRSAPQTDRVTP